MVRDEPKLRVLVVEDEEPIRRGLCDVLAFHGYAPVAADSGEQGLARGTAEHFDLVILDVMLPGINGFDVCERLRRHLPHLPILMLTAKGSEDDVVDGLRRGADDYVTKPFSIRELTARVTALLRRSGALGTVEAAFTFGPWRVDAADLRAADGTRTIELTRREVEILALFARTAGRVVSRRTLLQEVWGMVNVDEIETRTVDVHIAKLRKKIDAPTAGETAGETAGDAGSLIETVRGAGYRFLA